MSEYDYYEKLLKDRVKKRVRPFQYLMIHVFLMVSTLILMAFGMEYGYVSEGVFFIVTVPFILSMIAHALWYGNLALKQRIEFEEIEKLRHHEKPKRDSRHLEDGELVDYDDFLHESEDDRQQAYSKR